MKKKRRIRYVPISLIDLPKIDVRSFRNGSKIEPLIRDFETDEPYIPLTLRSKPNGRFECLDGGMRLEALKKLGYTEASAIVIDAKTDVDAVFTSLTLSFHRSQPDALGVCEALKYLCDTAKIRQKEIASRMCWSKGYVSKLIRIARFLDPVNKHHLARGEISIPQAYALVSVVRSIDGVRLNIPPDIKECSVCHRPFSESEIERKYVCFECERRLSKLLTEERRKPKQKKLDAPQSTLK